MSEDVVKDFYKVTAMSQAFRKWDSEIDLAKLTHEERVKMWELRFTLTIAQQLAVISAHLGKIVGKAGDKSNDQG